MRLGKFPGPKTPRGVSRQPGSLDGAAREHLIRNWRARRDSGEKREVVLSSLRAVVVHKDPVSLIPLCAFADVFPFSPPNRPSPPCVPPVSSRRRRRPHSQLHSLTLSLSLSLSLLPPRSPVTAQRDDTFTFAYTRTQHATITRALCTVRDEWTGVATLPGMYRPQRRDREARCCQAAMLHDQQPLSRGSTRSSVAILLFSRGNLHVYISRITIFTIYWPKLSWLSISYISSFFCFLLFFFCFTKQEPCYAGELISANPSFCTKGILFVKRNIIIIGQSCAFNFNYSTNNCYLHFNYLFFLYLLLLKSSRIYLTFLLFSFIFLLSYEIKNFHHHFLFYAGKLNRAQLKFFCAKKVSFP